MIITGGENVYSAEVENALAKHPAVAACAVIGVPDESWGERVHAVVVLPPGAAARPRRSSATHCKEQIAGYKAPRSVEFVERAAGVRRRQDPQADAAGAVPVSRARPDRDGPGWRAATQKLRPASGSSTKAMAIAS